MSEFTIWKRCLQLLEWRKKFAELDEPMVNRGKDILDSREVA